MNSPALYIRPRHVVCSRPKAGQAAGSRQASSRHPAKSRQAGCSRQAGSRPDAEHSRQAGQQQAGSRPKAGRLSVLGVCNLFPFTYNKKYTQSSC